MGDGRAGEWEKGEGEKGRRGEFSHSPILPFSHSPIRPFSHSPLPGLPSPQNGEGIKSDGSARGQVACEQ